MHKLTNPELMHFEKTGRLPDVVGGPFPPACPVCGQRRDQCVCPPITVQQAADTARCVPSSRTFFAGGEEPAF